MSRSNLAEAVAAEEREHDLRASLRTALQRLDRAKASREELVGAVYSAAKDACSALEIPPVPAPKKDVRSRPPEVAVAMVSDLQLAKVTRTYNTEICKRRMKQYAEKVLKFASIQRADHPVRELRVWLLGDIVEGEMIFPGQAHLIDASLYRQAVLDAPEILTTFIQTMLTGFDTVKVTGVIGNHGSLGGRARREYNPTSNADRMAYRITQQLLRNEPRVTWNIPDSENERDWYAVERVGKKGWLLCHGDQFRWGIKTPSTEQKILGWHSGAIPEPFDEVACGHWHNLNLITLKGGGLTLRCNGSTESYNTYAQEHVGSMSEPGQWVFFVADDVSAEYRVKLT